MKSKIEQKSKIELKSKSKPTSNPEKIQKLLAQAGVCSRREAERRITDERVKVNGELAHLGQRITPDDRVEVDGKLVKLNDAKTITVQVLLYNKPLGEVCSRSDPEGRTTIFDKLPKLKSGRWISVGRLDLNSSGLLLLTNSGELAHRLMHPSYEMTRTYRVRIDGKASSEELAQLLSGIQLEDGIAKCDKVRLHGKTESRNCWYEIELHEGKNREVRRLWQALGYRVSRLVRIKYAKISLPKQLKPGQFVAATAGEIRGLQQAVGI